MRPSIPECVVHHHHLVECKGYIVHLLFTEHVHLTRVAGRSRFHGSGAAGKKESGSLRFIRLRPARHDSLHAACSVLTQLDYTYQYCPYQAYLGTLLHLSSSSSLSGSPRRLSISGTSKPLRGHGWCISSDSTAKEKEALGLKQRASLSTACMSAAQASCRSSQRLRRTEKWHR